MRYINYNIEQLNNIQQFAYDYAKKSCEISYYPLCIQIEPTNYCNYKCEFCYNKNLKNKGFIEIELVNKIIEEVKEKTLRIGFVWRGEPLLNKNIGYFVKVAAENNLKPYIVTNGSLLSYEISVELIKNGLNYINFSLDSIDSDYYNNIRKNGSYEDVLNNIKDFLIAKRQFGSRYLPYTVISFIEFSSLEKEKIMSKFSGDYINNISFTKPHNWAGSIKQNLNIKKIVNKFDKCSEIWKRMIIGFNGNVYLCCMDMAENCYIGNIKNNKVIDIWKNNYKQFREKIKNGNYAHPMCEKCIFSKESDKSWYI